MICKSCGAEYSESSMKCPYCGTENLKEVFKQKKEILQSYDIEAGKIRKEAEAFPRKKANQLTRMIVRVLIALAVIGALGTVAFILCGKLSVRKRYREQQEHLRVLEGFYEALEYQEMDAYCEKHDLYERTYQKYIEVVFVNHSYEYFIADMEEIQEIASEKYYSPEEKKEFCDYWMKDVLWQAANVMQDCQEYLDDGIELGNEQVLEKFYGSCKEKLEELGYSEEEIRIIGQLNNHDKVDEQLIQRLMDVYL